MRALTSDMLQSERRPYFLWDEDISIEELRALLQEPPGWERDRILAKMLREARDIDVWEFVSPAEVADALPRIERRLGRRAAFWRFLIEGWPLEPQAFERASSVIHDVAASTQSRLDVRQEAPGFRRYALIRGDEGVVIDLVLERVPQLHPEKVDVDGVLVDPADEILANKLTALTGRMEERDLVDVFHLEKLGLSIEQALPIALQKDGGCTPATLAWLLSQIHIPDDARLPGGMSPAVLRQFVNDLVRRLLVAAAPK